MTKLKVLMVGNATTVRGGITSVIQQLLNHDWARDGIRIKFIPTYVDRNIMQKIMFFLIAYIRIWRYLYTERPDIVHIHMSYKGSFVRANIINKLANKYGAKVVVHLHGSEFEKWFYSLNKGKRDQVKNFLHNLDVLIVLGEKWKSSILRIEPSTKVVVIRNTIEIPSEKTNWNEKQFRILFLGVLIPRKGVKDLLQAISLLKQENKLGKIKLTIAGDGKEKDSLFSESHKMGLDDIVEFTGWINENEKKRLFLDSQLLVLPSYNEGLPVSILEAISYGLPIIATNVGDVSSAVINGSNGFLFTPGDVSSLMNLIFDISCNRKRFYIMSMASRQLAISKFSSEYYFETIKKVYCNL